MSEIVEVAVEATTVRLVMKMGAVNRTDGGTKRSRCRVVQTHVYESARQDMQAKIGENPRKLHFDGPEGLQRAVFVESAAETPQVPLYIVVEEAGGVHHPDPCLREGETSVHTFRSLLRGQGRQAKQICRPFAESAARIGPWSSTDLTLTVDVLS